MPVHPAPRARAARLRRFHASIEALEGRALLASLGLDSATIRPDGRTVELVFSGPLADPIGLPDWSPAATAGNQLTTSTGVALEPLGTVVTTSADQTTLVWTSTFLVTDPAQVLVYGAAPLTLSAEAGLFDDGSGNQTAALDAAPVVNRSLVDADGFTTEQFERGGGGVTLYVSSTKGNDSRGINQAQNPATPLRSLQTAFDMLRDAGQDGKGAAIRLLRGDVFAGDARMTVSGQDRDHPFVLEDYWHNYGDGRKDTGARPIIRSNVRQGQNDGLRAEPHFTKSGSLDHVVIRRIQIDTAGRFDSDKAGIGLKLWTAGTNITVDDCLIDDFRTNIAVDDVNFNRITDFTLLRTTVIDAHFNGVGSQVKSAHAQGLFAKNVDGLLISQSTFDRNGRTTSNYSGRNIFSHNIYIQYDCGTATLWGNVIRAGGSHGVQMRSGGILAYNYMARNAINGFISYPGGAATHNIVERAENIGGQGRGHGLGLDNNDDNRMLAGVLEFNIVLDERGKQPRALFTDQERAGILNALIRNNTLVNAGYFFNDSELDPNDGHSVRLEWNLNISGTERALMASPNQGDDDWYDSDNNLLHADSPDQTFWRVGSGPITWNNWLEQTQTELASVRTPARMVNSTVSIAGYVNGLTETDIVNKLRTRRTDAWTDLNDTLAIYDFFASKYRPTNLTSPSDAPLEYYGAVDYRLAAPDLVAADDTGISDSDNITTRARDLKFLAENTAENTTVELWRDNTKVASTQSGGAILTLVDRTLLTNGTYLYTVRQVDPAGNRIVSAPTAVTVDLVGDLANGGGNGGDNGGGGDGGGDNGGGGDGGGDNGGGGDGGGEAPPATLLPPDLADASDTGLSDTDNITKTFKELVFLVGETAEGSTVELWRGNLLIASSPGGSGLTALVDPGRVPDGTHAYTLRQTDAADVVTLSEPLLVTIDTMRPDAPVAPDLADASDTGDSNTDDITTARSLEFLMTLDDPTASIRLMRRRTGMTGGFWTIAERPDSGSIVDPGPLDDGQYDYIARTVDAAGNVSIDSPILVVTVVSDEVGVRGVAAAGGDGAWGGSKAAQGVRFGGVGLRVAPPLDPDTKPGWLGRPPGRPRPPRR